MEKRAAATTHKKAVVLMTDQSSLRGYVNPSLLGQEAQLDVLTENGAYRSFQLAKVKTVYFVREFSDSVAPERKSFLSRPKLDGLWVRLRFRDNDTIEGIVPNDLLDLLQNGVRLTPPDLHGNILWMFIPRTALLEMKVLGVVGAARRRTRPPATPSQPKLFND